MHQRRARRVAASAATARDRDSATGKPPPEVRAREQAVRGQEQVLRAHCRGVALCTWRTLAAEDRGRSALTAR